MVKLRGCSSARMFYWTSVLLPACNYGKINRVWTEICLTAVIGGIFMNCVCFSLDCSTGFVSLFCRSSFCTFDFFIKATLGSLEQNPEASLGLIQVWMCKNNLTP